MTQTLQRPFEGGPIPAFHDYLQRKITELPDDGTVELCHRRGMRIDLVAAGVAHTLSTTANVAIGVITEERSVGVFVDTFTMGWERSTGGYYIPQDKRAAYNKIGEPLLGSQVRTSMVFDEQRAFVDHTEFSPDLTQEYAALLRANNPTVGFMLPQL